MKRLFLLLIFPLFIFYSHAQIIKKYPVNKSGCFVYMFCDPVKFDEDYSQDSSKVYTATCTKDEIHYGVICAKLLKPVDDLDEAQELAAAYLDYLKVDFEIKSAVGYGKGNHLNSNENTRGIVDYWKDKENNNWKVKAWTDGKFIAVLYTYTKTEVPDKADVFLNSLRFPGM
jgi:hypothetical protein